MHPMPSVSARRPPRGRAPVRRRTDDQGTRRRLLEVAGQVIATKGVDRATGKEICSRAKVNAAAINYHFGSFERLYEAVLCEAHSRVASVEALRSAVAGAGSARQKLEAVLRLIVTSLTGPLSSSWVGRVLVREMASPSPALAVLRATEIWPKVQVLRHIVAELTGLPESHPSVARGCVSVVGPCLMMLLVDRQTFEKMFPSFGLAPKDTEAIVEHLVRFSIAGLKTIAAGER